MLFNRKNETPNNEHVLSIDTDLCKELKSTKRQLEEYKKKYEDLKYNVETFVNPDILDIKKVEIGTIFNGGNRDDMKKLILLNLDNIVDNLYHEVSMGAHCTDRKSVV